MKAESNPVNSRIAKRTAIVLRSAPVVAGCLALVIAASADFHYWSSNEVKGYGQRLSPKMNAQKVASETLANFGNHQFVVAHREASGQAEIHEHQADLFIVQSGEATLILGGEVVGGTTTAPNEIRGSSIKGGEKRALKAGDIVHIGTKVPHQLLLEPGKKFTYAVLKVDSPPMPAAR
jgi:mannose-6-phosphate isomerase-like protein (cupin superfamily)